MKNMSFRSKLICLCLFLSFVGCTIGVISTLGLGKVENLNLALTRQTIPRIAELNLMDISYQKIRIEVRTLGLAGLSESNRLAAIEATKTAVARYETHAKRLGELARSEREIALYKELNTEWLNFKAIGLRAVELASRSDEAATKELMKIFLEDCPIAASSYQAKLDLYQDYMAREVKVTSENSETLVSELNILVMIVSIVGLILGLGAGIILSNKMAKSIKSIVDELIQSAKELNYGADNISKTSQSLSEATVQQAASVQETSASLEEITSMVNTTANNAHKSADLATSSYREASKGKDIVLKMIHSMSTIDSNTMSIMDLINQNNTKMNDIVSLIKEIDDKTQVINDIVFQTKLLSFNASVEAARAGEAGKGFAVVAEEVGNLAAMSGKAAVEIANMLSASIDQVNNIAKESTAKVQSLIEQTRSSVVDGSEVARECGHILEMIVESVTHVTSSVSEISSATTEQSQGVLEIKEAVRQIDDVTQSNSAIASESARSAKDLLEQADLLNSIINQLIFTLEGKQADQKRQAQVYALNTQTQDNLRKAA